jgi:hypothetical protein
MAPPTRVISRGRQGKVVQARRGIPPVRAYVRARARAYVRDTRARARTRYVRHAYARAVHAARACGTCVRA